MKLAVCSVLACALAIPLALPVHAQQWPPRDLRPGERLIEEIGVVTRPAPADSKALQEKASVTCSLVFSPAVISNSQQSFYSTNYGGAGCVNGNIVETVTWNWTSTVPTIYGEFETQKKQLVISGGCLASSGHVVSSPSGLGINGPTLVTFEARDWPGNNLICSATAILTVI